MNLSIILSLFAAFSLLPAAEKNRISHRAIAFTALSDAIRANLGLSPG